jgi:hypothetical protein
MSALPPRPSINDAESIRRKLEAHCKKMVRDAYVRDDLAAQMLYGLALGLILDDQAGTIIGLLLSDYMLGEFDKLGV